MTCPVCGDYSNPDPDTGYNGDDLCPKCKEDGYDIGAHGEIIEPDPNETGTYRPSEEPCDIIRDDEIPF